MNWQLFNRYQSYYLAIFWIILATIHGWINAETVVADYQRLGNPVESWQPYLWEFSSQYMWILLIPLLLLFDRRFSLSGGHFLKGVLGHGIFSIIYSVCHVVGMVAIRKIIYANSGGHYDFGDWQSEFFYEYRKDGLSYLWLVGVIYSYRFIISRLRGEAKVISEGEDTPETKYPERLLVKKIGKEFIIKVADIAWIEAAGNYMNLHVNNRVYPIRETMSSIEKKLDANQFVRIHRSFMVNIDNIKEITPLDSGDYNVQLNCGNSLKLSRRYREKIKSVFD